MGRRAALSHGRSLCSNSNAVIILLVSNLYLYSGLLMAWLLGGADAVEVTRWMMAALTMTPFLIIALAYCLSVVMRFAKASIELCLLAWTHIGNKLKVQASRTAKAAVHLVCCACKETSAFVAIAFSVETLVVVVSVAAGAVGIVGGLKECLPTMVAAYYFIAYQVLSKAAKKLVWGFLGVYLGAFAVADFILACLSAMVACLYNTACQALSRATNKVKELAVAGVKAARCLACSTCCGAVSRLADTAALTIVHSLRNMAVVLGPVAHAVGIALGIREGLPAMVAGYCSKACQVASKPMLAFLRIVERIGVAGIIGFFSTKVILELVVAEVSDAAALVTGAAAPIMCKLAAGCRSMLALGKYTTAALHKLVGCADCALAVTDAALAMVHACAEKLAAAGQQTTPAQQSAGVSTSVQQGCEKQGTDSDAESEAESSAADIDTPPRLSAEDLCCPAPAIGRGSSSLDSSSGVAASICWLDKIELVF